MASFDCAGWAAAVDVVIVGWLDAWAAMAASAHCSVHCAVCMGRLCVCRVLGRVFVRMPGNVVQRESFCLCVLSVILLEEVDEDDRSQNQIRGYETKNKLKQKHKYFVAFGINLKNEMNTQKCIMNNNQIINGPKFRHTQPAMKRR